MANYCVGDIQGCYDELCWLLDKVAFDQTEDTLWLTGDLVARGPDSLNTLRLVKSLGDSARTVLGNHDLHLIAVAAGIKKAKEKDYLQPLLDSEELESLILWLRQQPLLRKIDDNTVICHAGIPPTWTLEQAFASANRVSETLNSDDYLFYIKNMYDSQPDLWQDNLPALEHFRYTLNALTRMRYVYSDKRLEFKHKDAPGTQPKELLPWFEVENPSVSNKTIIFGHWASLQGNTKRNNRIALDTGCVWGNHLTFIRLEDRAYFTHAKAVV